MFNPLAAIHDFLKSKPTEDQVKKQLEYQQKLTFTYLVDATNMYFNLIAQKAPSAQILKLLSTGQKVAKGWLERQIQLEKMGAPVYRPIFFERTTRAAINKVANDMRKGTGKGVQGIGSIWNFIGWDLVIPGAGAILKAGSTMGESLLKSDAEDQKLLLEQTQKTCTELKLNSADCKALISENLATYQANKNQAGPIERTLDKGGNLLMWGFGLFVAIKVLPMITSKKQ